MATYTKETALYDTGAIGSAITGVQAGLSTTNDKVSAYITSNDDSISQIRGSLALKVDAGASESTDFQTVLETYIDSVQIKATNVYLGDKTVESELNDLNSNIVIDPVNSTVRIGQSGDGNFNVYVEPTKLSFRNGMTEIAYLSGQELYITQSVVLQQMDVGRKFGSVDPITSEVGKGQWSWKVHPNGENPSRNNLNLKWIG